MAKTKLEKSIRREEQAAEAEYYYLQQLKQAVYTRDNKKVRSLIKYLGKLERRLWRYHKVVNRELDALKSSTPDSPRLRELQARVNIFANDVLKRMSDLAEKISFSGLFRDLSVDQKTGDLQKRGWETVEGAVISLENDIRAWEVLDRQLLQESIDIIEKGGDKGEGRVSQINYTSIQGGIEGVGNLSEKIVALLSGKGEYRAYTVDQRRKLWNRYQLAIKERILKYVHLDKLNLLGFEFYNFKFVNVSMDSTDFTKSSFVQCHFSECRAVGTIFNYAKMQYVTFERGCFNGASFLRADMRNSYFKGVLGPKKTWSYGGTVVTYDTVFERVNLDGADLRGATINGTAFTKSTFTKVDLEGASIDSCSFRDTVCRGTNFSKATLGNIVFDGADLMESTFALARGTSISWKDADVSGADLTFDYLRPVNEIDNLASANGILSLPMNKFPLNISTSKVEVLKYGHRLRKPA